MIHKIKLPRFFAPLELVYSFHRECVRCGVSRATGLVEALDYWQAVVTACTMEEKHGGLEQAREKLHTGWKGERAIVRPFSVTRELSNKMEIAARKAGLMVSSVMPEAMVLWTDAMAKLDLMTLGDMRTAIDAAREQSKKERVKVLRFGAKERRELQADLADLRRTQRLQAKYEAKRSWI